jgi:hypothetical protein
MFTLQSIPYVVQGRRNTARRRADGRLVRLVEPGRTIEDPSPRVVRPLQRRIDIAQDVHGSHLEGRSSPRFAF